MALKQYILEIFRICNVDAFTYVEQNNTRYDTIIINDTYFGSKFCCCFHPGNIRDWLLMFVNNSIIILNQGGTSRIS